MIWRGFSWNVSFLSVPGMTSLILDIRYLSTPEPSNHWLLICHHMIGWVQILQVCGLEWTCWFMSWPVDCWSTGRQLKPWRDSSQWQWMCDWVGLGGNIKTVGTWEDQVQCFVSWVLGYIWLFQYCLTIKQLTNRQSTIVWPRFTFLYLIMEITWDVDGL